MNHPQNSRVRQILSNHGYNPLDIKDILQIGGGFNNEIFELSVNNRRLVIKIYPQKNDAQSRKIKEATFIDSCSKNKIKAVPIIADVLEGSNAILFEKIEGKTIVPSELKPVHIDQMKTFLTDLGALETANYNDDGSQIFATDFSFTREEFINNFNVRVKNLKFLTEKYDPNSIIRTRLPDIEKLSKQLIRDLNESKSIVFRNENNPKNFERFISPSDFGLHNSLIDKTGTINFIDFEYAGIDDPANLILDTFINTDAGLPSTLLDEFIVLFHNYDGLREKIELLSPLFGLKWVCIVLKRCFFIGNLQIRDSFYGEHGGEIVKENVEKLDLLFEKCRKAKIFDIK